jgi:hypothetical protein
MYLALGDAEKFLKKEARSWKSTGIAISASIQEPQMIKTNTLSITIRQRRVSVILLQATHMMHWQSTRALTVPKR